jgi:hypothetical protein
VKQHGKKIPRNAVWTLPAISDYQHVYQATLVAPSIPAIEKHKGKVTGGDISADGQFLILRTYARTAYLWRLPKSQTLRETLVIAPKEITLADEKGAEAICFGLDGSGLFTVYDGKRKNRPLHVYPRK